MTNKELYNDVVDLIGGEIPGFEVGFKNESTISKIIGVLLFFNPLYMTAYITTRFPKVFFPSREYIDENWEFARAWKILTHEYVHLWDRLTKGVRFTIGYLMPHLLAVLALSALFGLAFGKWHALSLLWLWMLLPLPALWRMKAELRGYTMTMAVNYWRYGSVKEETVEWIAKQFTGAAYYFMWPFYGDIKQRLELAIQSIEDDSIFEGPEGVPFLKVYELLEAKGLVKA